MKQWLVLAGVLLEVTLGFSQHIDAIQAKLVSGYGSRYSNISYLVSSNFIQQNQDIFSLYRNDDLDWKGEYDTLSFQLSEWSPRQGWYGNKPFKVSTALNFQIEWFPTPSIAQDEDRDYFIHSLNNDTNPSAVIIFRDMKGFNLYNLSLPNQTGVIYVQLDNDFNIVNYSLFPYDDLFVRSVDFDIVEHEDRVDYIFDCHCSSKTIGPYEFNTTSQSMMIAVSFDKAFDKEPFARLFSDKDTPSENLNGWVHPSASSTLSSNIGLLPESDLVIPAQGDYEISYVLGNTSSSPSFNRIGQVMSSIRVTDVEFTSSLSEGLFVGDFLKTANWGSQVLKNPSPQLGGLVVGKITGTEIGNYTIVPGNLKESHIKTLSSGFTEVVAIATDSVFYKNKWRKAGAPGYEKHLVVFTFSESLQLVSMAWGPTSSELNITNILEYKDHLVAMVQLRTNLDPGESPADPWPNGTAVAAVELPLFGNPDQIEMISAKNISCSEASLHWEKSDADHYTVLISQNPTPAMPTDSENYNYSPEYDKAFLLDPNTRIVYQGSESMVTVKNLIAGRKYFVTVIPGNGPWNYTNYNTKNSRSISFNTPGVEWQKELNIDPSIDTGACEQDTLNISAISPYRIEWMDGEIKTNRLVEKTNDYFFLSKDPLGCIASSDTFAYSIYPKPELTSFKIVSEKPWCEGDTVQLQARSKHELLWSTKETGGDIKVTISGWYGITASSDEGCKTTDSLEVRFDEVPTFKFLNDSLLLYSDETDLLPDFKTDADSFQWIYANDTSTTYADFSPTDKIFLKARAQHKNGCYAIDSLLTLVLPIQLNVLPNAFTPNDDGVNDVWKFYPSDSTGTLTIFDRWGEILLKAQTQEWDGIKQGQELPDGVYFLMYEYEDSGKRNDWKVGYF